MNEYEIEDAARRWADHPVLGPATRTLTSLVEWTNRNSDGWCYWPKPGRAASRLCELVEAARRGTIPTRPEVRKAYRPLKAFRTRHGHMPYWSIEDV
jgi:hypothetical protein